MIQKKDGDRRGRLGDEDNHLPFGGQAGAGGEEFPEWQAPPRDVPELSGMGWDFGEEGAGADPDSILDALEADAEAPFVPSPRLLSQKPPQRPERPAAFGPPKSRLAATTPPPDERPLPFRAEDVEEYLGGAVEDLITGEGQEEEAFPPLSLPSRRVTPPPARRPSPPTIPDVGAGGHDPAESSGFPRRPTAPAVEEENHEADTGYASVAPERGSVGGRLLMGALFAWSVLCIYAGAQTFIANRAFSFYNDICRNQLTNEHIQQWQYGENSLNDPLRAVDFDQAYLHSIPHLSDERLLVDFARLLRGEVGQVLRDGQATATMGGMATLAADQIEDYCLSGGSSARFDGVRYVLDGLQGDNDVKTAVATQMTPETRLALNTVVAELGKRGHEGVDLFTQLEDQANAAQAAKAEADARAAAARAEADRLAQEAAQVAQQEAEAQRLAAQRGQEAVKGLTTPLAKSWLDRVEQQNASNQIGGGGRGSGSGDG